MNQISDLFTVTGTAGVEIAGTIDTVGDLLKEASSGNLPDRINLGETVNKSSGVSDPEMDNTTNPIQNVITSQGNGVLLASLKESVDAFKWVSTINAI